MRQVLPGLAHLRDRGKLTPSEYPGPCHGRALRRSRSSHSQNEKPRRVQNWGRSWKRWTEKKMAPAPQETDACYVLRLATCSPCSANARHFSRENQQSGCLIRSSCWCPFALPYRTERINPFISTKMVSASVAVGGMSFILPGSSPWISPPGQDSYPQGAFAVVFCDLRFCFVVAPSPWPAELPFAVGPAGGSLAVVCISSLRSPR